MSRRNLMLVAVVLAVILAVLLARRSHSEREEMSAVEQARAAAASARSPTPLTEGAPSTKSRPAPETDSLRRGLWRLEPEEAARLGASRPPHPWNDYLKLRDDVLASWAGKRVKLNLVDTPITDLPAVIGAMTGLTLRIDPAIASEGRTITWRGSSTAKSELTSIAYNANGRFTVGADGIACIGPRFSRAETEPVFAEELLLWEFGAARREEFAPDPEDSGKLAALRERLENPATQRVEIVRKTALEALDEISRLYGVEFCYPGFRTGEKPLWDEEASFVSEAATLKEALKGVLSPLACEYRVRPSGLLLLNSQQAKNEDRMTALDEAEVKGHDAAISKLRDTRVNLDGSPLAAEDIIEECARQAGIPFHLDPRLLTSPARWKAVAADLPLGQVLDEVASGTGGEWELRNAKWPKSGNYKSDGCALWFMATRWSTPEPEEK